MDRNDLIIKNIKGLREAFGESQEKLGDAIGVSRKTISSYERGVNVPDNEIIIAISKHYFIPVQLMFETDLSKLSINNPSNLFDLLLLYEIFPIIEPDESLNDGFFNAAITIHKLLFDNITHYDDRNFFKYLDVCINLYNKSINSKNNCVESYCNLLGVFLLLKAIVKFLYLIMNNKDDYIFFRLINKNGDSFNNTLCDLRDYISSNVDLDKYMSFIYSKNSILMLRSSLKKINMSKYNQLADYYLALNYMLGDDICSFNSERNVLIGVEMLYSFSVMGNEYTNTILEKVFNICLRNIDTQK